MKHDAPQCKTAICLACNMGPCPNTGAEPQGPGAALAEQPAPVLTEERMRELVKECGLDWQRGYVPLFDGDPTNRYAVLIEATIAAAIPPGHVVVPVEKLELLRFIQRVLEGDAPQADKDAAAQMVRDLRQSLAARPGGRE